MSNHSQISKSDFMRRVEASCGSGQNIAKQELVAALRMFDIESTGFVSISTMRNILVNLGDRLDSNEVETVVAKMRATGQ